MRDNVNRELGPECRRPATERVQLDVLCTSGLQLGDVRLTHAEPLGELRLGHAALGAECRELLFDHHLVEVLLHLPLEVGVGLDLMIDPLREVALSGHHHAEADEEILITRHGRPAAVLVSPDEYESRRETRAIHKVRRVHEVLRARPARRAPSGPSPPEHTGPWDRRPTMTTKRFPVFDCDSHVVEPPEIWDEYVP